MPEKVVINLTNIYKTWGDDSVQFESALATTGISHDTAMILMQALGKITPTSKPDAMTALQSQIRNLAIRPKPT